MIIKDVELGERCQVTVQIHGEVTVGYQIIFETHQRPHLDEITALWLLDYADKDFFDQYTYNGILVVGVGGGVFDEHPANGNHRKKNECAASLIAKAIDINDDPAMEKILQFVKRQDLKGGMQPFDLADIIRAMYDCGIETVKIIEFVFAALDAKYGQQLHFLNDTREEFERTAIVENILTDGNNITVVKAVSDNEQIARFARSNHGVNADIVIQQNSSGNVQIFANKKSRLGNSVKEIIRILRVEEQRVKGDVITNDWTDLEAEGKVEGVEEWYFVPEAQMILNGSKTAPNVPPTRLSLEKIQQIVRIGTNQTIFEKSRMGFCSKGKCIKPCPWFNYGLYRCRTIRREMHRNKS